MLPDVSYLSIYLYQGSDRKQRICRIAKTKFSTRDGWVHAKYLLYFEQNERHLVGKKSNVNYLQAIERIMAQEIERKFLVKGAYKKYAITKTKIVQGFLSTVPERTVRVRINDDKGFLTVKGIGNKSGASRYEWEKEISLEDAKDLMAICEPGVIEKTRYLIKAAEDLIFEVDEFYGENEGLTVAEIELPSEDTEFSKPEWLGAEVTGKVNYYNSMLMKNPFKNW